MIASGRFLARKVRECQKHSSGTCSCPTCKDSALYPNENELHNHSIAVHGAAINRPLEGRASEDFIVNRVYDPIHPSASEASRPVSAPGPSTQQILPQDSSTEASIEAITGKQLTSLQRSNQSSQILAHTDGHDLLRVCRAEPTPGDGPVLSREFSAAPGRLFDRDINQTTITSGTHLSRKPCGSCSQSNQRGVTEVTESHICLKPGPELLLQSVTRPISHEQLLVEVKGIYAGLVIVEAKCIEIDNKQFRTVLEIDSSKHINFIPRQWQALTTLHRTLLHEHHDFFMASQHPSARPALSQLAARYSMPARMWHHGIYAFLEVLRYGLPDSFDHLVAFIGTSYSMLTLLYETVPTFEDTWIEYLGDLGRYRMAIEDDVNFRDEWSETARFWYAKAADNSPVVGRHYHQLAILARPYSIRQLGLYTRSLTCIVPFERAKHGIMTLFNPILDRKVSSYHTPTSMETDFIKAHALLFTGRSIDELAMCVHQLLGGVFENHIYSVSTEFGQQGVFVALSNIAGLLEYGVMKLKGASRLILRFFFEEIEYEKNVASVNPSTSDALSFGHPSPIAREEMTKEEIEILMAYASDLAFGCLAIGLQRIGDKNVYPMVHVYFAFLFSIINIEKAVRLFDKNIPWEDMASFLNSLPRPDTKTSKAFNEDFPRPNEGIGRPLPEDFIMRGLVWSESYFPDTWFSDAAIDDEERALELPRMAQPRVERLLWLGNRVASCSQRLLYNENSRSFSVRDHATRLLPKD